MSFNCHFLQVKLHDEDMRKDETPMNFTESLRDFSPETSDLRLFDQKY